MSLPVGLFLGSIASCVAVTASNPFDVVKTRLQMDQTAIKLTGVLVNDSNKPSLRKVTWGILRNEGLPGIQRGLMSAYVYQVMMNGARFGLYDPLKEVVYNAFGRSPSAPRNIVPLNALAGFIAGALSNWYSSPLMLVKTRLQATAVGAGSKIGQSEGMVAMLRTIYQTEGGLRGLFHGSVAASVRTGVGGATQFATYDWAKAQVSRMGVKDGVGLHFLSSMLGGLAVTSSLFTPSCVSERYYAASAPKTAGSALTSGIQYRSAMHCLVETVKDEGVLALWKGAFYKAFLPMWLRIGPHTVCTFIALEQLKKLWFGD
ncbi:mitochondrial carrier [Gonapodya prolifera JEL478]|uniref:Mitochondrial carrier n=1 Tax=Gonapodya prolifera (strain JEL478) TaxID=1344416 RepID=A0A139AX65_GONPJ|nr:mitochondrial carrier [Gonapodya prolifera JEL478]|eukprot:KXS21341.1 mitochondrial carrier [Gonapodya prolifera JEL478]